MINEFKYGVDNIDRLIDITFDDNINLIGVTTSSNIDIDNYKHNGINSIYLKLDKDLKIIDKICNEKEMYFKGECDYNSKEEKLYLKKNSELLLNTYFNSFSVGKWKKYTNIKDVTFKFSAGCKCIVKAFHAVPETDKERIYQERRNENLRFDIDEISGNISQFINVTKTDVDIELLETVKDGYEYSAKFSELFYAGIVYVSIISEEDTCISDIGYYTDFSEEELNRVKFAIGICTFKREQDVIKNVQKIKNEIIDDEHSVLNKKLEVYISDNGQTLPKDLFNSSSIHVFPNINLGGSAGFTRTIIESMINDKEKGFTHIILMDDDMIFSSSVLEKTFLFLSLLKREYSLFMIGGAMFFEDKRTFQLESGALYDGTNYFKSSNRFFDMRNEKFVVENEVVKNINYQGWWYSCIPAAVINEKNLPLPFFIHFDDIEYGVRNFSNELILLNGICAWHPQFINKSPVWVNYYDIRNYLIMSSLYKEDNKLKYFSLVKTFGYFILSHRYKESSLLLKAINDFNKGFDYFKNLDAPKLQQDLFTYKYISKTPEELQININSENLNEHKTLSFYKTIFIQLLCIFFPVSKKNKSCTA